MKINRIYLKNINSFKGEHTINFTSNPLSNAGLFAIVGPTGAGKSTLLDAITLALFNRIPRFDKKVSKDLVGAGGSILTRGERECSVEIEYTSKSGTYISKWWINVNKNNNLNDYGMEIVDKNTDIPITNKKTEVPDKNQQFIGLSYDQFVKSILLSQGEFSKFLKSGKDERGKLLEDITGMQIYRQLGQKAFQIFKEKGSVLTEKRQHKNRIEVKLVSEEIEQKWEEDLRLKQKNRQDNEAKLELYKSKISLKNELKTLQESITQKEAEKLKAQSAWQKFEEEKIPLLSSHEAAEPFKEKIAELENEEKVLANTQARLQTEKIDLAKNEQQLWQNLQAIEALTKTNINTDNAFKVLQEFRNTVTELINQQRNQEEILTQRKSQIREIIEPLGNEKLKAIQINQLSEQSLKVITEIAEVLKIQRNEWLALSEIQDENQLSLQREKFETARKSLGQLKNLIKEFSEAQKEVNDATKEEEKQKNLITTNSPILEKTQKQLTETEILIEKLELEKNKLSKSYNFDKERHNLLQKDEPCPLCGSVEHPFLSHYANNYIEIDQEIIAKKTLQKELSSQVNLLNTTLETAKQFAQKEANRKKVFDDKRQEKLEEINGIKNDLGLEKIGNVAWVDEQIASKDAQINAINLFEKSTFEINAFRNLYNQIKETLKLQSQNNEIFEKLKSSYTGNNINSDCDKLQQSLSETNTKIISGKTTITSLETEFKAKLNLIAPMKEALMGQIQSGGFKDFEDLKRHLLSSEILKSIREERERIRTQINTLTNLLQEQNNNFQQKAKEDNASVTLEELNIGIEQLNFEKQGIDKELVELKVLLNTQKECKSEISTLNIEIQLLEKSNLKWELLDRYIGDAEGKKFSTFAQGLTLSRLIALSNKRLSELSDRYLLDKPHEKEDDELMVIDQYMGNERRSVKTLSGGETFLISLSLALALSDLASRNVRLESLFIDEGFGTLDPETLDTALCTLEKLQQEGQKNIGIISHVESIKERISTQIRMQKNSRGFSKIEIV